MNLNHLPALRTYLLRVEGVNLDHFVYDTADLSTSRGGSLELLAAARDAKLHLSSVDGVSAVEPLSIGASAALLKFTASPEVVASAVEHVRECLRGVSCTSQQSAEQRLLAEATFVVGYTELNGAADFPSARERLLTLGRWDQMQAASLAVPEKSASGESACAIDGLRPVPQNSDWSMERNGHWTPQGVSRLAKLRKSYGRKQKQLIYRDITGLAGDEGIRFAQEFREIALHADDFPAAGKVAVFYADGNRFGKIQERLATTVEAQQAWDTDLRGKRAALLGRLLESEVLNPEKKGDWLYDEALDDLGGTATGRAEKNVLSYRLETLLWGGDELIWVVPAWCGWRVATLFFEETAKWEFEGKPLTHSAGMVICGYKAPIRRIAEIARNLADAAKSISRTENQLAVEVLESFDDISGGVEDMWKRRTPPGEPQKHLILPGGKLAAIGNLITVLSNHPDFPRSQLHELITNQLRGAREQKLDLWGPILARRDSSILSRLNELRACFESDWSMWIALQTYWDYAGVWDCSAKYEPATNSAS